LCIYRVTSKIAQITKRRHGELIKAKCSYTGFLFSDIQQFQIRYEILEDF